MVELEYLRKFGGPFISSRLFVVYPLNDLFLSIKLQGILAFVFLGFFCFPWKVMSLLRHACGNAVDAGRHSTTRLWVLSLWRHNIGMFFHVSSRGRYVSHLFDTMKTALFFVSVFSSMVFFIFYFLKKRNWNSTFLLTEENSERIIF